MRCRRRNNSNPEKRDSFFAQDQKTESAAAMPVDRSPMMEKIATNPCSTG